MGAVTKIEWCDYTWSPWHGCAKVSPGCANCYAEALSGRNPGVLGVWGPNGSRVVSKSWDKPLAWDRAARKAGERRRVFPSLCDPFEDRPELAEPRRRLADLIWDTPNLDWLLLTKRPENAADMIYRMWFHCAEWPRNFWLGTSVENADYLHRIDKLKGTGAPVLFLSVEPLLGPMPTLGEHLDGIDWAIVGGESGPKARPCNVGWVRSIRDQCESSGVPVFIKQDSGPRPGMQGRIPDDLWAAKEFPKIAEKQGA